MFQRKKIKRKVVKKRKKSIRPLARKVTLCRGCAYHFPWDLLKPTAPMVRVKFGACLRFVSVKSSATERISDIGGIRDVRSTNGKQDCSYKRKVDLTLIPVRRWMLRSIRRRLRGRV